MASKPEAGGKFTYLDGSPIVFTLDEEAVNRQYAILGASVQLHTKLARLASSLRS